MCRCAQTPGNDKAITDPQTYQDFCRARQGHVPDPAKVD